MLTYAPLPTQSVDLSPLSLEDITDFVHENITVPANGGTTPAIGASYNRPNDGHYNGLFVNNSTNTCFLLFVQPGDVPTRNDVINNGLRLNANGSTFQIPDKTVADIYFATSATTSVVVRGIYFSRGGT
jgi:hypothetical protein